MTVPHFHHKLVVVGSANIDLVTRVPRCPKAGESLLGSAFTVVPGGKGANQAVAAARLNAETAFVGCVGLDDFGARLSASLEKAGVAIDYLIRHDTEPTGAAVIFVADDGSNAIAVTPGANRALTPQDIERARPLLQEADALLVQLEVSLDATEAALRIARELGVLSVLDAGPAQSLPPEIARLADIVSPNETEAEAITDIAVDSIEGAEEAARAIQAMGARKVVMKLGELGSIYVGGNGVEHASAFRVNPIDTVGAGDAFTAALAYAWNPEDVASSLRFANAAGAIATTRRGAQDAMPTRSEIDTLLKEQSVNA